MSLSCLSYGWAKQSSDPRGSGFSDPPGSHPEQADFFAVPGLWRVVPPTLILPLLQEGTFAFLGGFFLNAMLDSDRQPGRAHARDQPEGWS